MSSKPREIHEAAFVTSATRRRDYPKPTRPQVAFAGRSNCGKSSLLNCLVRRKGLAKTSSQPGRTQLVNFFLVNNRFYLVDLPGYGYAKAPLAEKEKWRGMIEEFLGDNPDLKLLVLLLDARRTPSELDDMLVDFLADRDIPTVLVLTKADKLKRAELDRARRTIAAHYGLPEEALPIATSATKNTGRNELLRTMLEAMQ